MPKKKPIPLWLVILAMFLEIVGLGAICYGIWHNVKCAFGVH